MNESVCQHMHKANWKHPSSGGVSFNRPLHPVLIVRLFVGDYDHLSLSERQLVFVISIAVVQRSAATKTHRASAATCWGVDSTCHWIRSRQHFRLRLLQGTEEIWLLGRQ